MNALINPTTPLWTSTAIATATNGMCSGNWDVTGVSIDSRAIQPGDLFIPLKGPNFDGHDYIAGALKQGAVGAISARAIDGVPADKLVMVDDSFTALEKLGVASRARSQATILAVTGSVGKTGCKEALRQILGAQAATYANVGSFNNHWGVPLSLARLSEQSRYGVFEIGMNHTGELGPLSRMVRPHIAIITTIAPVHIGNFTGLDGIASAKAEIFDGLAINGHAIIDGDNAYADFLTKAARAKNVAHIHRFGRSKGDAQLINAELQADGSKVEANILGTALTYYVGAPGEHWVKNSLAVLLAAKLAGANLQQAAETFANLQLAPGRGVVRQLSLPQGGTFTLIDESYNASPIAVDMAIRVLGKKQPGNGGQRILALADMRELGETARDAHLSLLEPIKNADIGKVFGCGEMMKHLYDTLPANLKGGYAFTSAELAPMVAKAIQAGDIITVKGSHSMMMEKVVAALNNLSTPNQKASVA